MSRFFPELGRTTTPSGRMQCGFSGTAMAVPVEINSRIASPRNSEAERSLYDLQLVVAVNKGAGCCRPRLCLPPYHSSLSTSTTFATVVAFATAGGPPRLPTKTYAQSQASMMTLKKLLLLLGARFGTYFG
ncbi:hypothetical protein Vretimale_17999 [Volvox reticuliferus]|uniref:Uncharacterized protein n=1 Tax=Volvox reticuliferus TaxID=1737510 RepID=A0A8J4GWE0_9CHLO|nr:hypothetical protein Vretimale_17999 [Volvox reticuliferus]